MTNVPAIIQKSAEAQGLVLSNVNLIMPTESYGAVMGQFEKVSIEIVRINSDDPRETYEPNGKGKGFALGKVPLQAIAAALSIQWDPRYTGIVESTATRSRAKAVGVMRKPNGESIIQTEEKTIDLEVESDELYEKATKDAQGGRVKEWVNNKPVKEPWKNDAERLAFIESKVKDGLKQKRKFKDELATTGAKDRVIRAFLALKSTYTAEELSKPLAFPRVSMDTSKMLEDPRTQKAALSLLAGATRDLFGKEPEGQGVELSQAATEMRQVGPDAPTAPAAKTDPFAGLPGQGVQPDPEPTIDPEREALKSIGKNFAQHFDAQTIAAIDRMVADPAATPEVLRSYVNRAVEWLGGQGVNVGTDGKEITE